MQPHKRSRSQRSFASLGEYGSAVSNHGRQIGPRFFNATRHKISCASGVPLWGSTLHLRNRPAASGDGANGGAGLGCRGNVIGCSLRGEPPPDRVVLAGSNGER